MVHVQSTAIREIDYAPWARQLYVTFASGKTYVYDRVPQHVYERFADASSKGAFFNEHVRGRYAFAEARPISRLRSA